MGGSAGEYGFCEAMPGRFAAIDEMKGAVRAVPDTVEDRQDSAGNIVGPSSAAPMVGLDAQMRALGA